MSASTARPVSATRDQAKEMIQHCRTMNSWYSYLTTQDQHLPRCPSSTDAGFDDLFEDYCVNMWTMWDKQSPDEKKKAISKWTASWWDSSALLAVILNTF
jgi:hypothetical protein